MTYIIDGKKEKPYNFGNRAVWLIIYFLIAQSLVIDNNTLLFVSVILSIGYSLFAKVENVFSLLCGLSMFESVFSIQGNNAWFLLLLIFVAKILLNNGLKINAFSLCSCLIVICLELVNDYATAGFGQFIVNITCVIFAFMSFVNVSKMNAKLYDIICSLSFAFICVTYYVLTMEGGIGNYISSFMSAAYAYRFGHSYGETVGGAMAIPLYVALIISCTIAFFLLAKRLTGFQKAFGVFTVLITLVVGAMTVSRSFYLCLLVILVCFLLFKDNKEKKSSKFWIVLAMLSLAIVLFCTESEIVNKLLESLQLRMDAGVEEGSGGRTDIWLSCINYLLTNPMRLFFGSGATNYKLIGVMQNELFSAGSHNLLLDLLMSWGIVGTVSILIVCISALKQVTGENRLRKHSLIPLITYLVFSLTALRCCNMKTWIFLLITYVFIVELNRGERYDT